MTDPLESLAWCALAFGLAGWMLIRIAERALEVKR